MSDYRHTQRGGLAMVFAAVAFVALIAFLTTGAPALALVVTLVFALWLAQFTSLTVSVTSERIRVAFGIGWLRKTIPTAEVESVRTVRNPWYYGWGIRFYPRGWLFNVGGFDAVELSLRDGRSYRIGTDEPDALRAAIEGVT